MRRRSTEIIQRIIKDADRTITLKQLAIKYGISQKTLKNDLKEINQFLCTIPVQEIKANDEGELILGDDFDEAKIKRYLYEMDTYMYKLSPEERQIYILIKLVISNSYITMQSIAEELYVSRITIVNDMEVIKEKIKSLNVDLILDSGKGMILECEEKEKIALLVELYRSIAINIQNDGFFQRMILNQVDIQYSFSSLFEYMQEYMNVSKIVFIEDIFYDIVLYLFVVFNFAQRKGKVLSNNVELSSIEHMILYAGHMLNVTVTQEMLAGFQEYIAEHKLSSFVKTVDEIELYKTIMTFIREIDNETKLNLVNDSKLMDSLLMHIRSMKDWGNYEIELPKEYDSSINYERLEKLVNRYAYILEKFLSYKLSTNMKKSIVIHICVAIIRNRRYLPKISVVIVCPGSMATGKYLEAQIKNYFDFHIIGVVAAHQVLEQLDQTNEHVDFIISTVSIHTDKYEVIKVHPFLKMDDLNLIQKLTLRRQTLKPETLQHKKELLLTNIQGIFEDPDLIEILSKNIEKAICEFQNKIEKNRKNVWQDLFDKEMVEIEENDILWKDAMRRSAKPLEDNGFVTTDYIEKAISNVEEYGDYIMVSKGVALAHASKDSGVLKDGISLLVSKKGIKLTEGDNKVYLMFCFASTGEKEYYELIKNIIMIGRTEGRVEKIRTLSTTNDIYQNIIDFS